MIWFIKCYSIEGINTFAWWTTYWHGLDYLDIVHWWFASPIFMERFVQLACDYSLSDFRMSYKKPFAPDRVLITISNLTLGRNLTPPTGLILYLTRVLWIGMWIWLDSTIEINKNARLRPTINTYTIYVTLTFSRDVPHLELDTKKINWLQYMECRYSLCRWQIPLDNQIWK